MPNWCLNTLTVTGTKKEIATFRERAMGVSPINSQNTLQDLSFNSLIPIPKEYLEDERWYNFTMSNWGVKWDAELCDFNQSPEELIYIFYTAWNPPEEFVKTASTIFPNLEFVLKYEEPGMNFMGYIVFISGEKIEEEGSEFNE